MLYLLQLTFCRVFANRINRHSFITFPLFNFLLEFSKKTEFKFSNNFDKIEKKKTLMKKKGPNLINPKKEKIKTTKKIKNKI